MAGVKGSGCGAPKGHPPYPGCEKGGRPREWTDALIEEMADKFEAWMSQKNSLWYEDFALEMGLDPDLLSTWAKQNEKFAGVYKRSKSWQKSLLIRGGLLNKFNSNITKLVLFNTCGWADKQETKLSGDATNPLEFIMKNVDGTTKELIDDKKE